MSRTTSRCAVLCCSCCWLCRKQVAAAEGHVGSSEALTAVAKGDEQLLKWVEEQMFTPAYTRCVWWWDVVVVRQCGDEWAHRLTCPPLPCLCTQPSIQTSGAGVTNRLASHLMPTCLAQSLEWWSCNWLPDSVVQLGYNCSTALLRLLQFVFQDVDQGEYTRGRSQLLQLLL